MKLKGINWFERNVEKLVLGVTGTALLGVVLLQVVTQPNKVTINKKELAPQDAFVPAEDAAKALLAEIDSKQVVAPDVGNLDLGQKLSQGIATRLSPAATLATALGRPLSVGQAGQAAGVGDDFAGVTVPVPTGIVAAGFRNTISPLEKVRNPELAKFLPAQQPFDKAAVSVQAVFSGAALREALVNDPDGDGPIQPPSQTWWKESSGRDLIDIVAVELERECISPADGSKETAGSKTIVSAMPGRASSLKLWADSVRSAGDIQSAIGLIQSISEEVQRPRYYGTIAGDPWAEPSEMIKLGDVPDSKQRQVENLKKRLDELRAEITDLDSRIASAPTPEEKRRAQQAERTPPPASGRGGRPGAAPAPTPAAKAEPVLDKRELENRKKIRATEATRLEARLADLGEKPATTTAPGAAGVIDFLENPEIKVWAHDVTGEPGASYRYRLRVVVNNPLFDRNVKNKELAKESLLRSPWSEWSAPVAVDRSDYFFVTSAADRGVAAPSPRASAELYVFYYGYWRRAALSLEPGDTLIATAKLPAELPIYDLAKIPAAGADPASSFAPPPPPPPPPGGGRRTVAPGGDRELVPTPGVPPIAPMSGEPGEPGALAGVPSTNAPTEMPLKVDAIFLDVARRLVASGLTSKDVYDAVLRDGTGRIVARSPDLDKGSDLYRRLEASAKAGVSQGKPVIRDEPQPVRPIPRPGGDRDTPRPPPRPTGGGGGG